MRAVTAARRTLAAELAVRRGPRSETGRRSRALRRGDQTIRVLGPPWSADADLLDPRSIRTRGAIWWTAPLHGADLRPGDAMTWSAQVPPSATGLALAEEERAALTVVATCDAAAEACWDDGWPAAQITVVAPVATGSIVGCDRAAGPAARRDHHVLGVVGPHWDEGRDHLLRAFDALPAEIDGRAVQIHLVDAGGRRCPEDADRLLYEIDQLGLGGRVALVPVTSTIATDVVVDLSPLGGLAPAVAEAAAAGLPTVRADPRAGGGTAPATGQRGPRPPARRRHVVTARDRDAAAAAIGAALTWQTRA